MPKSTFDYLARKHAPSDVVCVGQHAAGRCGESAGRQGSNPGGLQAAALTVLGTEDEDQLGIIGVDGQAIRR